MSVRTQSREPLLRNITSLFRLLILLSFISDDVCEDISCPKPFKEMTVEKVNCTFNLTSIGAPFCLPMPTDVLFSFSNKSVKGVILCSTSSNGICGQEPVGNMNCSCIRSAAGIHTYQLNFMGNKTSYLDGNITCTLFCKPSPPVLRSNSCTFLEFAQEGSEGCGTGCIVGAVIGSCAGAILVGCIVRWAIIDIQRKQRSQL